MTGTTMIKNELERAPVFDYSTDRSPLSSERTRAFLKHQARVMEVLAHAGYMRLNQSVPLTYKEWEILLSWALEACKGFESPFVQDFFNLVVERGISDLHKIVDSTDEDPNVLQEDLCKQGPLVGKWVSHVLDCFDQTRIKDNHARLGLIKKFSEVCVMLSQKTGKPVWFGHIASRRFPDDRDAQVLWVIELYDKAGIRKS